jgi:glycosyltransferase involved in cell wall biosynthesis
MSQRYLDLIRENTLETLLTLPHKHLGIHPTGFVVRTNEEVPQFPFTVCPLTFCKSGEELPGTNPHDVIVDYTKNDGDLESILYKLYQLYFDKHCEQTSISRKRYIETKTIPSRKIIIPCLGRKENLIPTLKRLQQIDLPGEGYRPIICIVEHSPSLELQQIAEDFGCEYLWIFLDPRDPTLPIGQFNKALAYDKAFLYTSPAEWYLFHDNDVLVPRDFWNRIDANVKRAKTQFLQPYTHRSLLNTTQESAEYFRNNVSLADEPPSDGIFLPNIPGAPGGSLYLKRERYLDVGGHDPNYCWGYGPEDLLFFNKLKLFEPIAYADEPPIEMIHLWHPTAAINNPFRFEMDWFVKIYMESRSMEERKFLMGGKKSLLEKILRGLETTGYFKQLD